MEEQTVGKKIRFARKQRGLTQKELGNLCGIDEANIRKYELEKQKPRLETLEKIALALEIDTGYFGKIHSTTDITFFDKTKTLKERNAAFQDVVIDIIENQTDWVEQALLWTKKRKTILKIDMPLFFKALNEYTNEEYEENYYHIIQELIYCFESLNTEGQKKLFSRISELLEMPKYTKKNK
nr:helix-turn-helix transcriptional regulator [uncultured Anaerotignum sp.]